MFPFRKARDFFCSLLSESLFLVLLFTTKGTCQQFVDASGKIINQTIVIENNDTLYSRVLPTLYVFPPMKFKNKSQEKF